MLKKLYLLTAVALSLFCSCSDNSSDEGDNGKDGPKPEMTLAVSPQTGLKYGDKITVTGTMTDEKNLQMYTIRVKDAQGDTLASKEQMLLGQSFHIGDNIQIPLPKNASTANLTLEVALDNTRNGELIQTFDLTDVAAPDFESLNLILSNGNVIPLIKNGEVYQSLSETLFPAGIKGIISTSTSKATGLYWGTTNDEIVSMGKDSLTIGSDLEASYTVSFNPKTFELSFGEKHVWTPMPATDCYYILGTISGHWMDGEITTERSKMKMTGYESGTDKYYTWTPPAGDDPETGMWGSTAAGVFRLKMGGSNQYILWDGTNIIQSTTDDADKSFPLTAAGPYNIRVYFEGSKCVKLQAIGSGKTLEFANGSVKINGLEMPKSIAFGGKTLSLKSGSNYIYEGNVALTKGQNITSSVGLENFNTNGDLFSGKGNTSWTVKSLTANYAIRMDVFNGAFYACPTDGYPNVIYMDGWSWGPDDASSVTWDANNVLPLVRTSGNTYEGTCYVFAWGGDIAFYVNYPVGATQSVRIPNTYFTEAYKSSADETGFILPTTAGYYKVVVDLKDGINISSSRVTQKGNTKFTLSYQAQ